MYKLSDYVIATDAVVKNAAREPARIVYATRSGKTSLIKDSVYQKARSGAFAEIAPGTLMELIEMGAIVPAGLNEFEDVLTQNLAAVADSQTLVITIQPTANCQLGCGYCGQKHAKKNVDAEMSMKITDRVISKLAGKQAKKLSLQWYGGEPLMAYSEILRMSERMIAYCTAHQISYKASMITNGMSFKKNVFINLLNSKINSFQITLDGGAETHDIMRITKEGKKTFNIIFDNIVEVVNSTEYMESDAAIALRINVNRLTAKGIYKLIDLMAAHELQKKRVHIYFAPVVDWGGNGADKTALSKDEFAVSEIDWLMYAAKKGFPVDGLIPDRLPTPCMVVQPEAEVYDALGNIFPCYEFPYTPKYDEAQYKIGHIDDDPATNNRNAVTKSWFTDIKTEISPCKKCSLFPVCGGGCPKQWYNNEIACPSFKLNIQDRLVLNYLANKGSLNGHLQDMAIAG